MRTKRWFALFFAAALAAAVLAGCQWPPDGGEDGSSSSSSSSSSTSRPSSDDDDSGSSEEGSSTPTYTVTINGLLVQLTGDGQQQTVDLGNGELALTVQKDGSASGSITPADGMAIKSYTVNGEEIKVTGNDREKVQFNLPSGSLTGNFEVKVTFAEWQTVTVSQSETDEGTIEVDASRVIEGDTLTVTVEAKDYYQIEQVTIGSETYTPANDEKQTMTITYTVPGGTDSAALFAARSTGITVEATFTSTIDPADPSTWPMKDGTLVVPASVTTLPDNISNTINSKQITGLDLTGSGVETIGEDAFYFCDSLQTVNLGSGVTSIDEYAFASCDNLETVHMGSVTTIDNAAFLGCTNLTNVDMGSVQTIDEHAFQGCTSLTNVDMGSVTNIGELAFLGCTSLTNVDMSSVTSIGGSAFFRCSSLAHIRLGNVLPTTVYPGAFLGAGTSASTITIYSDVVQGDSELQEKVKNWFNEPAKVEFRSSSEYPGAAAGNALAQYLTRIF